MITCTASHNDLPMHHFSPKISELSFHGDTLQNNHSYRTPVASVGTVHCTITTLAGLSSGRQHSTMPDWAEKVITWDEARQYIEEGTVESLGKLRRSEQQLATYRSFMDKVCVCIMLSVVVNPRSYRTGFYRHQLVVSLVQVKSEYASVADFVKISVLERTSRVNSGTSPSLRIFSRYTI